MELKNELKLVIDNNLKSLRDLYVIKEDTEHSRTQLFTASLELIRHSVNHIRDNYIKNQNIVANSQSMNEVTEISEKAYFEFHQNASKILFLNL